MLDFIWKSYDKKGNSTNAGIEVKTESLDSSYTQKNIKPIQNWKEIVMIKV